jgi:hypothetical protein
MFTLKPLIAQKHASSPSLILRFPPTIRYTNRYLLLLSPTVLSTPLSQLIRVFPISSSYFLTRLLFTQSPSAPFARILIGMEAHSEEEYEQHVRPFRGREWPDALLRFSVKDNETPRESQRQGDEDVPMDGSYSFEGRRRSRRHEHHHGRHHGHHRGHRHGDRPEWPESALSFHSSSTASIATTSTTSVAAAPTPTATLVPPFYGPPPPPPPPPFHHGNPFLATSPQLSPSYAAHTSSPYFATYPAIFSAHSCHG